MEETQLKPNIVLVDFKLPKDWKFVEKLRESTHQPWKGLEKVTNKYHGSKLQVVKRLFWYFIFPLQIVWQRNRFGKIVAWQQFYGLNIAFFCRLFHLRKQNELSVMTFIYKKKSGWLGNVYHQYMKYIVNSKYIDRFICFSKRECDYYPQLFGTSKERFVYLPIGIQPINCIDTSDHGYVFATGRSNRDYEFLVNVMEGTDYRCVIACDSQSLSGGGNVEWKKNCYGTEMLERMAHSHCVVIPLKDANISSGQLVMLQAMSLGKPVLCTDSEGISDYMTDETTIMLPNNVEKWRMAIQQLFTEHGMADKMGDAAQKLFYTHYTEDIMFENITNCIK